MATWQKVKIGQIADIAYGYPALFTGLSDPTKFGFAGLRVGSLS